MSRPALALALAALGCNAPISLRDIGQGLDGGVPYVQPIQPAQPAPPEGGPLPPQFPPEWMGQPGVIGNQNGNALLLIPDGQFVSVVQATDVNGNVTFAAAPTGPNADPGAVEVPGGSWPRLVRNGTHGTLANLVDAFVADAGGPPLQPGGYRGGGVIRLNGVFYIGSQSGSVPPPIGLVERIPFAATIAAQVGSPVVTFTDINPIGVSGITALPEMPQWQFDQMGPVQVNPDGTSQPLPAGTRGPPAPSIVGNPPTIANTTVLLGGTMIATAIAYDLGGPYWAGGTATVGGGISGYYYSGSLAGAVGGGLVSGAGFVGGLAGNFLAVAGAQAVGIENPTAVYWIGQGGGIVGGAVSAGGTAAGLTYLGVPVVAGATTAGAAFLSATGVGLLAGATATVGYHAGAWAAQYTTVPMAEAITNWYYANDIAVAATGFNANNGGQCTCARTSNTGGWWNTSTPMPPRTLLVPDQATCNWEQGQRFSQPGGSYIKYESCTFVPNGGVAGTGSGSSA